MSKYLLSVFLLSVFFPALGQECSYSLRGRVLDFHDKSPLTGATLYIPQSESYAYSNLNGEYEFTGLCAGSYEIEVMHPECRTLIFPVEITRTEKRDFLLEHHLEELDEVKVVGSMLR